MQLMLGMAFIGTNYSGCYGAALPKILTIDFCDGCVGLRLRWLGCELAG